MIYQAVYIVLCFIADFIIGDFLPLDFAAKSMIFVPALGFCSLILISRKLDITDSIFLSLGAGFVYGLFLPGSLLLYPILFMLVIMVTHMWSVNLNDTIIELLILLLMAIFVKEFLLYQYMTISGVTTLGFISWVRVYLFISIFGHIPLLLGIIYFYRHVLKLTQKNIRRKQNREQLVWKK
ncbi:hypothetical protein SDC9_191188 [bioreactor metagenome]|uniref:Rod shape-determining protein MreD n=1 Tax=bioreactor metagenome TaxID=1076179 RepID=A0A645HX96_9ZZZZ|nr:hypothetical protein [Erysipelotrichaceae bacterium]